MRIGVLFEHLTKATLRRHRKDTAPEASGVPATQAVLREAAPVSYHLMIDEARFGPVSLETLKQWNAEGRIPSTAWIWKEGDPEWDWRAKAFFFPNE